MTRSRFGLAASSLVALLLQGGCAASGSGGEPRVDAIDAEPRPRILLTLELTGAIAVPSSARVTKMDVALPEGCHPPVRRFWTKTNFNEVDEPKPGDWFVLWKPERGGKVEYQFATRVPGDDALDAIEIRLEVKDAEGTTTTRTVRWRRAGTGQEN